MTPNLRREPMPIRTAAHLGLALFGAAAAAGETVSLKGRVVDADTGAPLPARVYLEKAGEWFLAKSADPAGSAVHYQKRNGRSVEVHTTLSAHPFQADLPPGRYVVTAERGKEYLPASEEVRLEKDPVELTLKLRRWVDMAAKGWYSGDTHVHRPIADLPNVLLAEDLNIAFPLVHWVREAFTPPDRGKPDPGAEAAGHAPVPVDSTHLIVPRNTEYEIFTVGGKNHELGAFFVIGHRSVFAEGVPPLGAVAKRAHAEGALLELDKHSWPWSMALVPVMGVDLYELANNHLWRTEFGFRRWGEPPPEYMRVETDAGGITERGWIDYGFKNYYALLNSGFRLRPTAGTASGVHPVPLGFSRVYVHLTGGLSAEAWMRGLDAGKSFVTTGPMLFLEVERPLPGSKGARVAGTVLSESPISLIEVILNGETTDFRPRNLLNGEGALESRFGGEFELPGTSWIAARAFEKAPGGRVRFAHSAPVFIEVKGKPLRPRPEEAEFLKGRVARELERSKDLLPPEALEEYRRALAAYEEAVKRAAGPGER